LFDAPGPNPQETSGIVPDGVEDDATSDPNEDVTIRLVGGGGTAGTTAALLPDNDIPVNGQVDHDVAGTSVISDPLKSSSKRDSKKPGQKKSSMSGLRKLGHLRGLRKNDSSSSLKDMV
jgi:hypothetical protein